MLSSVFSPAVFGGLKFDRGMQLLEFDTIRADPKADISEYTETYKDAGRFAPIVGRSIQGCLDVVEIPTPVMLMPDGGYLKDGCITNHFESADPESLRSLIAETMARKIGGMNYMDIAPGYHRALWCPPPKIMDGLRPVRFHYPRAGYFGVIAEIIGYSNHGGRSSELDTTQVNIAFLRAVPSVFHSVTFVIKDSPIYRITNQEKCVGKEYIPCRLVVEFRGECDVIRELERLEIAYNAVLLGQISVGLPKPTEQNLEKNPMLFTNSFNDQILKGLKCKK